MNSRLANYANSLTKQCVIPLRCPSGTYARNDTKTCSSSCPAEMYGNRTTKTCQNCPDTCTACFNSTHCTDCVGMAELSASDSACYRHCNATAQYEYDGDCYTTCPDGSYVDYTLVNCQACNSICLTCSGNSLNCTSCLGTFKHNNLCVSKCPTGYYALNNVCLVCDASVSTCSNPLSFNTSVTTEDYRQVVILRFNQDVSISGDLSSLVNINLKMSRRLL